ncbi:hypothetical protein FEM48_Zijuj05G0081500 [Ziziphus jujuba var. spinosa]|uniref:AAA+ ATPase domain-containing protein n=1 Tax=Ziziphus jujuba var. spinosa TaxID=714518 RepID=A0A978VDT7_ZIZJJ|nr:hypothetical protein FEM48_Zijuj05G0081500 [Ziziphus jujuba var. spinosa]
MGSAIATLTFVWAIIGQYCPYEIRHMVGKLTQRIKDFFNPYICITIPEFAGGIARRSEGYAAVEAYLSSNSSSNANRLKAEKERHNSKLILSIDKDQILSDEEIITNSYLDHVMKEGKEIRIGNMKRRLYTNCCAGSKWFSYQPTMWSHIVFEHPASFETMAMETEKKREIIDDLLAFKNGKDYYAKIGKAWKRGYLLYGPPGTGKSTMIAAMANLLSYDIYDLELTSVKNNSEFRKLLIETTRKSIIVIEDIDFSLDLTGQRSKEKNAEKFSEEDEEDSEKKVKKEAEDKKNNVTLSGLLNFIDGLWSSCGTERIIVFTTNYVEKLDPALIRRGRMDKSIELSYCSFEGFKVLAKNHLKIENHQMFDKIEKLMVETQITPADVAEDLMPKSLQDGPEKCLSNLIKAMEEAKEKAGRKNKEEAAKQKNKAKEKTDRKNKEEAAKEKNKAKQAPDVKEIENNRSNRPET